MAKVERVRVWCVVRSPYGRPGEIVVVERTRRVEHYLRVGVLVELVDDPEPEPEPEPDESQPEVEGGAG